MTDELVMRLRDFDPHLHELEVVDEAADRIEALERERERLGREVNMARYGQPDFAWSIHKQAMADLQARAERLEAAIRELKRCWYQGDLTENDFAAALKGAKP